VCPALFLTVVVAAGFPLICVHTALVTWVDPAGIDVASGDDGSGLAKILLLGLIVGSITITYSAENIFKRRSRSARDAVYFSRVLPTLALLIGASLAHVGGAIEETASEGPAPSQMIAGFYLYLPMRYMLTRVMGISWPSILAWAVSIGVILAVGWE